MELRFLFNSVSNGYSLLRAYENYILRELELEGDGIDLGAKSSDAKYYSYISMERVKSMTFVDYYSSGVDVLKINLEKEFPIQGSQFDFVLLFNVLEHIYDTKNILNESQRVLKGMGKIYGVVPFLVRVHPDPEDYYRFTSTALYKNLVDAGFKNIKVKTIASGPFKSSAALVGRYLKFKPFIFLYYCAAIAFDALLSKRSSGLDKFPCGYYFEAQK